MNDERKNRAIKVLKMIEEDAENDATTFEGKPFNGKNVAEYLGNLGASIASLANILRELLGEDPKNL